METVVVERVFSSPRDFFEIEQRERAVADCLTVRRVSALCSYFSRDRRNLVCLYEAPDAESVKEVQGESGLPYDRVWSARALGDFPVQQPALESTVVVQRPFEEGTQLRDIEQMMARSDGCLHIYGVEHLATLISRDLRRGVCFFSAPDAEALRSVNESAQLPSDFVFSATIHTPSE